MFGNTFFFILLFTASNGFLLDDKSKLHCIFSKYMLNYFEINESLFGACLQHDDQTEYDHSGLKYCAENMQKQGVIVMAMLDELRNQSYSKFPADLIMVNLFTNNITGSVIPYSIDPDRKGAELEDDDTRIKRGLCNAYKMITGELRSFLRNVCELTVCYKKIDLQFQKLKFSPISILQVKQSRDPKTMYDYLQNMVLEAEEVFRINSIIKSYKHFHPSNMIVFKLMNRSKTHNGVSQQPIYGLDPMRYVRINTSQDNVFVVDLFERIKSCFNGYFLKSYQQQVMAASIYPVFSCTSTYIRMFKQLHLTNNGHNNETVIKNLGDQIYEMYGSIIHKSFLPFIAAKYVYDIRRKLQHVSTFYKKKPYFLNVKWINDFLTLLSKPMVLNRFVYNSTNEILDKITEEECNVLIENVTEEVEIAKKYTEALVENINPLRILMKSVNHNDMFQEQPLDIFNMLTEGTIYYNSFVLAGENSNRPTRCASGMGTDRSIGIASALTFDETTVKKTTSTVQRNGKIGGSPNGSKFQKSQSMKLPEKNKNGTSAGNQKKRVTLQELFALSPIHCYPTCKGKPAVIMDEPGDEVKVTIPASQLKCSHEQIVNDIQKEEGTGAKDHEPSVLLEAIETKTGDGVQEVPATVKQLRDSFEQNINDRLAFIEKNKYLGKHKSEMVESREKLTAQKKSDADRTRKTTETYVEESNDSERRGRRKSIDWENLPRRLPSTDSDKMSTNEEKLKKSMELYRNRKLQSSKTISSECLSTMPAKKDNNRGVSNVKSIQRLQKQQSEIFDRPRRSDLPEYNKTLEWDTDGCDRYDENASHDRQNNLLSTLKKPVIRKHAGDSTSLHCLFSEYILTYLQLNEKYFILKYGQSDVVTYTTYNLSIYESNLGSMAVYILAMLDELRKYEKNMFAFDLITANLYLNNLTGDLGIFSTEITTTQSNSVEFRREGFVANYRMMTEQFLNFTESNCLQYSTDELETRFGDLHRAVRRMDKMKAVTVPQKLMPELHMLRVQAFNSLKPTIDENRLDDYQPANMLFFDLMSGYVKRDHSAKALFPTRPRTLVDMVRNRQGGGDSAKFDDGLQAIREVVVNTSRRGGSNNSIIDAFYCVSLNFDANYVRSFQQQVLAATVHPVFNSIAKYTIAFKQVLLLYKYKAKYVQEITKIGSTLLNAFEKFIHLNLFSAKVTKYLTKLLDRLKTVINSQTKKSIMNDQPELLADILELCTKPMRLNLLEFNHNANVVSLITLEKYNDLIRDTQKDIVTTRAYVEALSTHRSVFDVVKRSVSHDDIFEKEPLDVFQACDSVYDRSIR
ncbi:uncharacterized protein LOC126838642 isoform X2 [Adelges cooleyi]|uniref:uncharacterized protein LOC126838642 isoform X2 n=1 Tax=Adelges cooleyi TaxID=133065 RepID=UPI00217F8D5D|nr:uncharacterized protein LOC126838642 isoform X2 [Adelges cooleyi]